MMQHPHYSLGRATEVIGAWLLAILWALPLLYAFWSAFHPAEFSTRFDLLAPLTLKNFASAWEVAPFPRYFLNTFVLVTMILVAQFIICTLAAYAFVRFEFFGREVVFMLVLVQLMIMPDVLIVENYKIMSSLGLDFSGAYIWATSKQGAIISPNRGIATMVAISSHVRQDSCRHFLISYVIVW